LNFTSNFPGCQSNTPFARKKRKKKLSTVICSQSYNVPELLSTIMSKSSQGGVQQSRETSTELPLNQMQEQVGSVDVSRKRNATSTCASSSRKRFRGGSSGIHEDLQVLDRELGRQSEDYATVKSEEDSLISNRSPEPREESPSNAQELSPEPDGFIEDSNLPAVTEEVIK
ncbi:hypothetical protein NA56DRAFT_717041, partial [Hyaloscypha hepaticicola]